jgi:hypothetical protein
MHEEVEIPSVPDQAARTASRHVLRKHMGSIASTAGVVGLVLGAALSYVQLTQGRAAVVVAVVGQLVGIVGLYLLGEDYYRPLALFILGTLVGAVAGAAARRRQPHPR